MAGRLSGLQGAVYIGSTPTKVLDTHEWTFNARTDLLPVDIKGDVYHRFTPDVTTATFTAKRYIEAFSVFAPLVSDAAVNSTQQLFRLDLIDGSGSFVQIQGQGYVTSGSLTAPYNAEAEDEFESQCDGAYTIT